MPRMVQIRNMPDDLHRTMKVRAAQRGVSLSDYLLELAARDADTVPVAELMARIRERPRPRKLSSAAPLIRAMRDADEW